MNKTDYIKAVEAFKDPVRAQGALRYFKTGPGQYGEGDIFWGLNSAQQRSLCKSYYNVLSLSQIESLMSHPVHEIRSGSLLMLVLRYQKNPSERDKIKDIYLANRQYINNWDLVDCSAHYILGPWCLEHNDDILFELATQDHLWSQRISMIACLAHIRADKFVTPLKVAHLLLNHPHDLIHKAVGWMLREIGHRDLATERAFLDKYYKQMPRTCLRYAIERFDEELRQDYLKGRI